MPLPRPAATFPTFARALHTVRRHLLLRRRLVASLLAAAAMFTALQALRPPAPVRVVAVVAARDLPAGTTVSTTDLRQVRRAADTLPEGHLSAAEQLDGEVLAAPVRSGEVITDARLLGPGLIVGASGEVAMSVRIGDVASVDLVRVGDAVDVIAVPASGDERASRVLVRAARVLALPSASTTAGPMGSDAGRVVVLSVGRTKSVEVSEAAAREWLSVALTR